MNLILNLELLFFLYAFAGVPIKVRFDLKLFIKVVFAPIILLLDREWFPTLYSIRNHEKYENVLVNQLGALYTPPFHPDTEEDL
jgi:hypothetical protein